MATMKSGLNLKEILTGLQKDITLFSKRDLLTVLRRLESEKISFLTKTLPLLGKALEDGLENGQFLCPTNFGLYKGTALPKLFRGLLTNIFCENGFLLPDACASSVRELRQICYFFNKVKSVPSRLQRTEAIKKFLSLEEENRLFDVHGEEKLSEFSKAVLARAQKIISNVCADMDLINIVPSDGPGAVADKRTHQQRLQFNVIYEDLHGKYPYYSYYHHSSSDLISRVRAYRSATKMNFGASRFCLVPKDSRGPRIITIEPAEYQYLQQGQRKNFVSHIEKHSITRGKINFTDQSINQRLAEASSVNRLYETVDLSDASDRVTTKLVDMLFPKNISELLQCTRTKDVIIPKEISGLDEDVRIAVHKYAGMGSAMCFPVEALVFFSLASGIIQLIGEKSGRRMPKPYVYGDDMIVPHGTLDILKGVFLEFNLVVNKTKSFSKGNFRESCGGDYFKGVNVTPIRLRVDGRAHSDCISLIETANQLHKNLLWNTEKVLQDYISQSGVTVYSHEHAVPSSFLQVFSKGKSALICGKRKPKWSADYQRWKYPSFMKEVEDQSLTHSSNKWKLKGAYLRWSVKTNGTEQSAYDFSKAKSSARHKYI